MRHIDVLDTRYQRLLFVLVLAMAVGGVVDLALDDPATLGSFHLVFEVAFLLLCLGTAVLLWRVGFRAQRSLEQTRANLARHEDELAQWRRRAQSLLHGLGAEIDRQMRAWGLSPAEREVALLLLKGFSTKEIATHLAKSERTVRQQCSAVYKRSGLGGRAELSAFFLEDLLLPMEDELAPPEPRPLAAPVGQP